MNVKRMMILCATAVSLVGCGSGSSDGTATAEDKKNLDNMLQNGIGGHPAPPGAAKPGSPSAPSGVPVSGKVDPP